MSMPIRLWLLASVFLLAGCSFTAPYNRAHITPAAPVAADHAGQVLVYTTSADDAYVFTGKPTSFTGGGTKLSLPLGMMTREIAGMVFSERFQQGHIKSGVLNGAEYGLTVHPKVKHIEYAYNQLKNLGFAITPQVRLVLTVDVLDAQGKVVRSVEYDSGLTDGKSYMLSGAPAEQVSKIAHQTLYDLMRKAADDLVKG